MRNANLSNNEVTIQEQPPTLPSLSETLVDQVTTWLADQIIQGQFKPGEELGIRPLAAKLGVSPTPIREALRSLQSEGLVELPPRRSPRVATLTKQDVLDIYSCRAYLNGLAAKIATERMTSDILSSLELLVNHMTDEAQQEDVRGYFALTVKFNELILDCAGNQVLQGLLNSLGRRTLRLRYLSIATPGRVQVGLEFHRDIVEAFRLGDAERAEQLMMRQIFSAQEVLLRHFLGNESA